MFRLKLPALRARRCVQFLTQRMEALFQKAETALDDSSFTPAQRDGLREAFSLVRQQTQQTGTQ